MQRFRWLPFTNCGCLHEIKVGRLGQANELRGEAGGERPVCRARAQEGRRLAQGAAHRQEAEVEIGEGIRPVAFRPQGRCGGLGLPIRADVERARDVGQPVLRGRIGVPGGATGRVRRRRVIREPRRELSDDAQEEEVVRAGREAMSRHGDRRGCVSAAQRFEDRSLVAHGVC